MTIKAERREEECMDCVEGYQATKGRGPYLSEIGRRLCINETAAARTVLSLIRQRLLMRDPLLGLCVIPHPESPSTSY